MANIQDAAKHINDRFDELSAKITADGGSVLELKKELDDFKLNVSQTIEATVVKAFDDFLTGLTASEKKIDTTTTVTGNIVAKDVPMVVEPSTNIVAL